MGLTRSIPSQGEPKTCMHAAELHDPVDTIPARRIRQRDFLRPIAHREPECQHHPIESRNRLEQIIDQQHAQRAPLRWRRNARTAPEQQCPVGSRREERAAVSVIEQPGGSSETNGRRQGWMDALARMQPILLIERLGEGRGELRRIAPRTALEKEHLGRGTGLLIELPHIARQSPAPGLPVRPTAPAGAIHRRNR